MQVVDNIDDYKIMWTEDILDYLLICPDPNEELSYDNAIIFNCRTRMIEGFEEDDLYSEIKRRMYGAGVKVVLLDDVRYLFKPPA